MSAAPSMIPVAAAVLLAGLMATAPAARSAGASDSGWLNGERDQYNLSIRGDNGNHYGRYKKDKKKNGRRNGAVVVPEPPMIVLLGTGLLVIGFVAWRRRWKA